MINRVDSSKFRWCKRPKIVCRCSFIYNMGEAYETGMKEIKKTVRELRKEVPNMKSIYLLQAPSSSFDWEEFYQCGYATIQMNVNGLDFQVRFKNDRMKLPPE